MRSLTGLHAIEEYLKQYADSKPEKGSSMPLLTYSKRSTRIDSLADLAKSVGVRAVRADEGELNARVGKGHHGVILEIPYVIQQLESLKEFIDADIPPTAVALLLDGITDPQNLGAILRSADQFGADLVILPSRRSAKVNDTVFRTSAGAAIQVPTVTVSNIAQAIKELKEAGFWVYGGDVSGKSAITADLTGRVALIMGSEGDGISRLIRESCDDLIAITSLGAVDSLNVSVAAGILLYEIRRQQGLIAE